MLIDFDLFPPGMVVFDQLPGLRFPTTPRVVTTAAGERALSNVEPGEEFNRQPLRIDFTEAQSEVSLKAGLAVSSSVAIDATLRALDETGVQIAQDGPKQIGPGPVEADTQFEVQTSAPAIRRVELAYSGAFTELIDDLEFDVEGDVAPLDVEQPSVAIVRPQNGASLTGESLILEATIGEERRLSEVLLTIAGGQGSVTFPVNHSGQAPDFRIGPFRTQPLAPGSNDITVTARDLAGNEGQSTVTVNRVPLAAILVVPDGPVVLRRRRSRSTPVRLEEAFPGSLDGRGEIDIRVAGPDGVLGYVRIRDFLNQPEPQATLEVLATSAARLGAASVFLQAVEVETDRIIATADLPASVVPTRPFECGGPTPLYAAATPEDLRQEMEAGIDAAIALPEGEVIDSLEEILSSVSALTPLQLTLAPGEMRIFRRFRVGLSLDPPGFPTADVNMSATIVRNPDVPLGRLSLAENPSVWETLEEDELPFTYQAFRVNASPNIEIITPIHAIAWAIAQAAYEREFSKRAREKLIRDFNKGIFERITAENEAALVFLMETRITAREFMFGFCVPGTEFRSLLVEDDFASDPLDGFEVVDDPGGVFAAPSSWAYDSAGRRILQTSNLHGPARQVDVGPDKRGTYLLGIQERGVRDYGEDLPVAGPWPAVRNFALESTMSSQYGDGIGIVFRYQNPENFYFFLMDGQRRYRRIGKKVDGVFQELEVVALDTGRGFDSGVPHRVLLMARDDTFSVYIDGVLALSGSDRAISEKGRLGFYARGNSVARFEALKVRPL
jgi:hypothetical protein